MIEIKKLVKVFGPIVAVDGVSLTIPSGQVLGFLGPNGAGKSTTMKMLTGFLLPTSGTAVVLGHDVCREPIAVKKALGYLPEGAPAYPDMTPESYLRFAADSRGLSRQDRKRRIARVVDQVHLEGVMRQPIETLSKGYKRRVGLAQALLHDPQVLILDEPTDGLDPNQKHEVRTLIRDLAGKKVVVLSTHILEEVEAVCTRAVIIARGKVVADGTPDQLRARSTYRNAVRVRVRGGGRKLVEDIGRLRNVAGIEEVELPGAEAGADHTLRCVVKAKRGQSVIAELSELLTQRQVQIDELHVEAGRLDEVFRTITVGENGEAA